MKLRRDRIVVVLDAKCYVYNFENLKPIHQIETIAENVDGVCALSSDSDSIVLACPGLQRGQVRVEIYNLRRTRFISAHEGSIACMELNNAGTVLATASDKGTLVRVFDTMEGTLLHEFRRGADRAKIHCLAFSGETCGDRFGTPTDRIKAGDASACPAWLAATSDKGTVHVWSLADDQAARRAANDGDGSTPNRVRRSSSVTTSPRDGVADGSGTKSSASEENQKSPNNPTSALSFLRGVLPKYFSSEWSFAHFRLPDASHSCVAFASTAAAVAEDEHTTEPPPIRAGDRYRTLHVVTGTGGFHTLRFDTKKPGECQQSNFSKTMKS